MAKIRRIRRVAPPYGVALVRAMLEESDDSFDDDYDAKQDDGAADENQNDDVAGADENEKDVLAESDGNDPPEPALNPDSNVDSDEDDDKAKQDDGAADENRNDDAVE